MDSSPKTRNAEATKAVILEAAEEVFAEKGFAGASIRLISKKSRVSGSLILFHFQSKEQLYHEVKAAIIRRYELEEPTHINEEDPIELYIKKWLAALFDFYRRNPTMVRLSNWGLLEGDMEPWPGEDELHHLFESRLKKAQEKGEIRGDISPLHLSAMMVGMIHVWWEYHEHYIGHSQGDPDEIDGRYLQEALDFVMRGMTSATLEETG